MLKTDTNEVVAVVGGLVAAVIAGLSGLGGFEVAVIGLGVLLVVRITRTRRG